MGLLLLQVIPVAIGIAVNPVPIIAALIIAGSRRPAVNGVAYITALIVVMALFGGVVLVLVPHRSLTGGGSAGGIIEVLWLFIGLGFLAAFLALSLHRPASGDGDREPRWMGLIGRLGPAGAAVVGILLVNYEMEGPALTDILHAGVSRAEAFTVLAVFIAIAACTPALPLLATVAAPDLTAGTMSRARSWLTAHHRPVLLGVFAAVAVVYTGKGLVAIIH